MWRHRNQTERGTCTRPGMRAEHALQLARGQLHALRQLIPGLLLELTLDGQLLHAQVPQGMPVNGTAGPWTGRHLSALLPDEAVQVCRAAMAEAQACGRSTGRRLPVHNHGQVGWWVLDVVKCETQGLTSPRFWLLAREAVPLSPEWQRLAFLDALTGLPNRRLLQDRLVQALHDSARNHQLGGVLFIDLDGFKAINDTQGHAAGDDVLRQAGLRLSHVMRRNSDTVARLGGDEFVAVLRHLSGQPGHAQATLAQVASQVVRALRQPYLLKQGKARLSASVGGVLFGGGRAVTVDELLQLADGAMYRAKAAGRNTWHLHEPHVAARQPVSAGAVAMAAVRADRPTPA